MRRLGIDSRSGGERGDRTRLKNQMGRLFRCSVQLVYVDGQHEVLVQSFVADRAEFWWDATRDSGPSLWDSTIQLWEQFFNEIVAHQVPLDLNILKRLKRSPIGLDLYFWLTYRTFALKRPIVLSWRQLYRQLGPDPAKANAHAFDASRFRASCLRELKKIKCAWPELNYGTVTGGLLIEPSPPRIPPSAQLRLISE